MITQPADVMVSLQNDTQREEAAVYEFHLEAKFIDRNEMPAFWGMEFSRMATGGWRPNDNLPRCSGQSDLPGKSFHRRNPAYIVLLRT
jgi:hypothetical protein